MYQANTDADKTAATLKQAIDDEKTAADALKKDKNNKDKQQKEKDAKDAKDKAAAEDKTAREEKKKARETFDKAHPGMTPDGTSSASDALLNELRALLKKVRQYADMLKDCEEREKKAGKCG